MTRKRQVVEIMQRLSNITTLAWEYAMEDVAVNLENAFKAIVEEIRHCEIEANKWLTKKQALQEQLKETLAKIQTPQQEESQKAKNKKVPQLIQNFLEQHGPSRSKDIYAFLLSQGVTTNPGVALGRLREKKILIREERGLYKLAH